MFNVKSCLPLSLEGRVKVRDLGSVLVLLALASPGLVGCVSADSAASAVATRPDYYCVKEKRTGSNRTVKVCHPRERSEIHNEQTQHDMRTMQAETFKPANEL